MAQFSQQEQNTMRREAARRVQEMQQRAHPPMPPVRHPNSPYADYPPDSEHTASHTESFSVHSMQNSEHTPSFQTKGNSFLGGLPQLNPTELLSKLDGDSVLILVLMAMIYKDGGKEGCDRKLLMALAYLLT